MLDIHTVSAGGGTISRIDAVGGLQVGPDSAGADPGPICYGQGGQEVTITDANLVLGVLNPDKFLGGRMKLNKTKAEKVLEEKIARPLALNLLEAADGILKIINVKMEEAIKAVSSQRGYDIRDFTLVAFGGAGPMHAGRIALDLGIPSLLIPFTPGVPSPVPPLKAQDLDLMRQRFDRQHEQAHGHKAESKPVELVSLRLVSVGLGPQARLSQVKPRDYYREQPHPRARNWRSPRPGRCQSLGREKSCRAHGALREGNRSRLDRAASHIHRDEGS